MTFLHKEDVVGPSRAFQPDTDTNSKGRRASLASCEKKSSSVEDLDLDFVVPRGKAPKLHTSVATPELPWTSIKEKSPLEKDSGGCEDSAASPTNQSDNAVPDIDMELDGCIVITDESDDEEEVRSLTHPHSPGSHSSEEPSLFGPFSSDAGYSSLPEEPCPELSSMFYLPQWDVCPKLQHLPGTQEKVRALLADVKDFLSRPPRPDSDLEGLLDPKPKLKEQQAPPEPGEWGDLFQVNFCLDVEEEEKLSDSLSPEHNSESLPLDFLAKPKSPSGDGPTEPLSSPGWDEVFDDVEDAQGLPGGTAPLSPKGSSHLPPFDKGVENPHTSVPADAVLDESMDLFGDDDDFLSISMPDSPCDWAPKQTLEEPSAEAENGRPKRNGEFMEEGVSSAGAGQRPRENTEDFDCSQELFPVNFDLGYSLEDSEEGEETGTGAGTDEVFLHSAALPPNGRTEGRRVSPLLDILPSPAHSRAPQHGCVSTPLAVNTGRRDCLPLTSKVASLSPIVRRLQGATHLPATSGGVARRSSSGAAGQPELPASKHCESPRVRGGQVSTRQSFLQIGSSFCENGPVNPPTG